MRLRARLLIGIWLAACGGGSEPGTPDAAVVDGTSSPDAYTGPATLDPGFGDGGIAFVDIDGGREARFLAVRVHESGSIALTGEAFTDAWRATTCRLDAGGALDVDWGTGGCVEGVGGHALLPVGDELLVGDSFDAVLWRYDAAGELVASFGQGGRMDFLPTALAIDTIVTAPGGGWFVTAPEDMRHAYVAKASDGGDVLDSTLSAEVIAFPRLVSGAILGDGTLLVGGYLGQRGSGGVLMRFSAELVPDARWTDGVLPVTYDVVEVAARSGGGFYVFTDHEIRRFTDDGQLDGSFADSGVKTTESGEIMRAAVVLPDTRLVTATARRPAGGAKTSREMVVRVYDDEGVLDESVGVGGALVLPLENDENIVLIEDATVDPDGNIVLTGVVGETAPRPWVARILAGE